MLLDALWWVFAQSWFFFVFLWFYFQYKANDDIIYVNFPFKIMRSFRSMFFFAIIWAHFKRTEFFGSLWIFGFRNLFIRSCLDYSMCSALFQCVREFFSHLSFAHRVSQMEIFSQTKTLGLCKNMQIHICRFSFRFGVFFFFLALEKKSDKQREIQKRNGMERKSQVILPRKWQCRNKEKRKRSGASKNHREEK